MNDESYVHVQEYWYLYEYLIYFLHEFISFKDMLSYKELNYDVYIYKSTETDYFITLFFINNYDEIWFICQLSISILKIQYEHVLLLDRFSKRSKVNSNIQNLIATTENSILFVFSLKDCQNFAIFCFFAGNVYSRKCLLYSRKSRVYSLN